MQHVNDEAVRNLLSETHTIAVVGANNRPGEPSYDTVSYEQSQGYKIIPVNPNIPSVLGQPTKASLQELQGPVDLVHVMKHHEKIGNLEQVVAATGCKAIWVEPGAYEAQDIRTSAAACGVPVITGKPFRGTHQRLMSDVKM